MAQCSWCKQEMKDHRTTSCVANAVVEYPKNITLAAIPYNPGFDYEKGHRCHDCNVAPGGYHHPGCDMEECPQCHGQLISCGCLDECEEDEENED